MSTEDSYLKAILGLIARQLIPSEQLAQLVSPRGIQKQLNAYNLCDGLHTQSEIAKTCSLDRGNFSKLVTKWEMEGIVFRIEHEGEPKPQHIYPLKIV